MLNQINLEPNSIIPLVINDWRDYMELGQIIKKLRQEMDLSQKEFASKVGLHPNLLAKYESGKTKPSVNVIARVAKFCEVSNDYLIYGRDDDYAKKARINDEELLDLLRRVDGLKKAKRDKVKWAVKSLINGDTEI